MLDSELDKAIAALIEQWNIAEQRIKKAEQVRANEVVSSAIFELRYAGRKIIDALYLLLTEDVNDQPVHSRVLSYIADATEDCVKAKHDAIDSMMDFVTIWFHDLEKVLSLGKIQELFPTYLETTAMIVTVQDKVAESRKNRTERRDSIYNAVDGDEYERVLKLYDTMRISEKRVQALVTRERRGKLALATITIVSLLFGTAASAALLIDYGMKWFGPAAPAAASSPSTGAKQGASSQH